MSDLVLTEGKDFRTAYFCNVEGCGFATATQASGGFEDLAKHFKLCHPRQEDLNRLLRYMVGKDLDVDQLLNRCETRNNPHLAAIEMRQEEAEFCARIADRFSAEQDRENAIGYAKWAAGQLIAAQIRKERGPRP